MIVSTVSFRVAPGKNAEATEYLEQIVRVAKFAAGADVKIYTQLGGPVGHLVLRTEHEDLNAWNTYRTKLTTDPKFLKLSKEAAENFIPGSVESALYQVS